MTHPHPACSPNCWKRTCSFHVDYGLPAATTQRNSKFKCHVRANEGVNTANDEPEPTREPHAHDVLCGRGGFVNKHPGNVIFRRIVEANKERYRICAVDHKVLLSKSIVLAMRSQSPPGRFLIRSPGGGEWVEVGNAKALLKTSQALREGSTEGDLRIDVSAESGPTGPSQEAMKNELLQQALIGFSNGQVTMNKPEVALSSQKTKQEIADSLGQAILTADVAISGDECTTSLEADSATIEESISKSIRDLSSVASEEMQLCELAAVILGEGLAPGDEAFQSISDDESLFSPYSDPYCLDAMELLHEAHVHDGSLHESHVHDASFGLLPEFRFDMGHGEDEPTMNFIAL